MTDADLYNMSDAFISYSRRDSDFVQRLFDDIKATGKEVWADFEDIPKAADWWREIQAGIDAADAFVFVISPDSINSDICRQEIDHAVASNKRILPILHREVTDEATKAKIHPSISSHNWIFFREGDDYNESLNILLESLETDLDHNRTLTRILVRAKEWDDNQRASSYLLVGEDLQQADEWLAHAMDKKPAPTNLHVEYISASREAQTARQRRLFTYALVGMVLALFLAAFALFQMFDAQRARDAAELAREEAETAQEQAEVSAQRANAIALSASSSEALANNNPDLALVLAQEAVDIAEDIIQEGSTDVGLESVGTSLADAAYAPGTIARLEMGDSDIINTVVYTPDGSLFAVGFASGDICLFDGESYAQISCLSTDTASAHSDGVLWIHMSEDGTLLLSSGDDGRLVLWDTGHDSPTYGEILSETIIADLNASSLSLDGTFAVFATDTGMFGRWDIASDSITQASYTHGSSLNVVALNIEGTFALVGSDNGALIEYDTESLELVDILANVNNRAPISSIAYHPDEPIGIAGDLDATITVWDLQSRSIIRTYQGHDENVTAISFADNARTIFTASWDNSIREWDVASGRIVQEFFGHNGGINALSLSGDNTTMVSGGFDGTIRVWLVHPTVFEEQLLSSEEDLNTADWTENLIMTGNEVGEIFIYDRNSYELLRQFTDANGSAGVEHIVIDPQAREFTVVFGDCNLSSYDMRGEQRWTNTIEGDFCSQALYRPNMAEILVMSLDYLTRIDARTGDFIERIPYDEDDFPNFRSMALSSDGTLLFVGRNDRTDNLQQVDIETGEVLMTFEGHTDGVLSIDVSNDDTRIVTGSFDNDVRVWDIATGETFVLLEGHSDRVTSVDFHPNGASVVSASNDTTMRLWDVSTGITRYTYGLHTDRVVTAEFSPDGRRVLTSSHDTTLIIWRFPQRLDELEDWVESNRYVRELSCGERNIYLSEANECD